MSIKIVLDAESEAIARRQVETGAYASVGEAVRAALHLLEEQEPYDGPADIEALKAAVEEGLAGGPDIPAEEMFAELKALYGVKTDNAQK